MEYLTAITDVKLEIQRFKTKHRHLMLKTSHQKVRLALSPDVKYETLTYVFPSILRTYPRCIYARHRERAASCNATAGFGYKIRAVIFFW